MAGIGQIVGPELVGIAPAPAKKGIVPVPPMSTSARAAKSCRDRSRRQPVVPACPRARSFRSEEHPVLSCARFDDIACPAAEYVIVAGSCCDLVAPAPAHDGIVASVTQDRVMPGVPENDVVSIAGIKVIVAVISGHENVFSAH